MSGAGESPAALLKRASELMRERAREMPPAPWRAAGRDVTATQDREEYDPDWDFALNIAACRRQDEAEHIASWHPGVALAVAELLGKVAWALDLDGDLIGRVGYEEAHKVARLYLGEGNST